MRKNLVASKIPADECTLPFPWFYPQPGFNLNVKSSLCVFKKWKQIRCFSIKMLAHKTMRQLFMKETLTAVTCVIWEMCFHLLVWTLTHFWVGFEVPQASPNKGTGTQFWNSTYSVTLCFHSPRWKGNFYVHSWGCFCIFRCLHLFIMFYPLFGLSVTHTEQCYEPLSVISVSVF